MAHWDGSGGPLGRLWRHLWAPRGLWERFRGHFGTSSGSIFDEKLDQSDAKRGVLLFGHIFQRIVVFLLICQFFKAWRHCVFHAKTSVFNIYTRCPTGWSFSNFHCHFGHTLLCFFSKAFHVWTLFGPKWHVFEPKSRPEGIRQTSAVVLGRFCDHLRGLEDVWGPLEDVRPPFSIHPR